MNAWGFGTWYQGRTPLEYRLAGRGTNCRPWRERWVEGAGSEINRVFFTAEAAPYAPCSI